MNTFNGVTTDLNLLALTEEFGCTSIINEDDTEVRCLLNDGSEHRFALGTIDSSDYPLWPAGYVEVP